MNTSATNLLRSLEMLGVLNVRFRVVGLGRQIRHTIPLAVSDENTGARTRLPSLSVADLFSAYALRPRKGEYVLNVDGGQLAFIPSPAPIEPAVTAPKINRFKGKIGARNGRRGADTPGHHKMAA